MSGRDAARLIGGRMVRWIGGVMCEQRQPKAHAGIWSRSTKNHDLCMEDLIPSYCNLSLSI